MHRIRCICAGAARDHNTARAVKTDSYSRKPGTLTTLEGDDVYDEMTLTVICLIRGPVYIPAIAGWLKGGGAVEFANCPEVPSCADHNPDRV